ncbi:RDD family protein [Massilia sp. YIM B02763]|uniref:RDD family protein n=1 Tax=Massilia sp. YIM B02763 TaxID=3050130 RepID=UPI0025B70360|nr:RDD family protein [Massilia sp. YIM B02763]MDN4054412.1 RDD family protein [Massilia sp. YIM B02763]
MTPTPSIKRRLTAMVYETFLLAAVEMLAVALWLVVTGNRHDPVFQHGLKAWLFLVTGAYFVYSWTNSGHTLAMKTWRLCVVTEGGARVPLRTAVLRYLAAWGWFLPALLVCWLAGLHGKGEMAAALAVGIAAWSMTALFDKDRRFLHDRLAGTRIVAIPKARAAARDDAAPAANAS